MPRLTTHVLDLCAGVAAAGIAIELWHLPVPGVAPQLVKTVRTNADGRTDEPLLGGPDAAPGWYELVFLAGDYFGLPPEARFLDRVAVRFQISEAGGHYHVPLLVTPWAYQTYRGS